MDTEKVYYKRAVNYTIGVKFFIGDSIGAVLTNVNPTVAVEKSKIREFKLANKRALLDGLIMETDEPSIDWETDNALSDEEITELTKSYLALRSRLKKVDSLPTLFRILENAKANDRARKSVALIEERIEELDVVDNFSMSPDEMKGVTT